MKIKIIIGMIVVSVCAVLGGMLKSYIYKNNDTLTRVSQLIQLPDEPVTVATVIDKEKLKENNFLRGAANGDVVLLFTTSGKAIIYRSKINKIIDVGQVEVVPEVLATPTSLVKIKVAVYNGTNVEGLASKFSEQILDKIEYFEVIKMANARNKYVKTEIINFNEQYREVAQDLANELPVIMSQLSENEEKPVADMLIIVGEDFEK